MRYLAAAIVLLVVAGLVSRRAALLGFLVLCTTSLALPAATPSDSFTDVVPRLVKATGPWAALLPFALVRGAGGAFVGLRLAAVAALAVESVWPTTASLVTGPLLAASLGALLDDLARRRSDPLLALGVLVLGALIAHDAGWLQRLRAH